MLAAEANKKRVRKLKWSYFKVIEPLKTKVTGR